MANDGPGCCCAGRRHRRLASELGPAPSRRLEPRQAHQLVEQVDGWGLVRQKEADLHARFGKGDQFEAGPGETRR